MTKRFLFTLALAAALRAQQPVAPTNEPLGSPRGTSVGDYNVTQTFELGYRFKTVGGDDGMYRSVDNYGNGIRLLGSSLSVNSKDGHGHYFDEILLNTVGLGNDNYQAVVLRVEKNRLYRYDMTWRLTSYYNPGLTVAGGLHFKDTTRRMQDHDVTLFPQSHLRFMVGYSRNTEDGPSLTTAQEFDANGAGLPVFANVRRQWNEYRLGSDIEFEGFKFTVMRRWDYFKDDTPVTSAGSVSAAGVIPGGSTDQTVLNQFNRAEPIHGANPGWLGNLYGHRKLWAVNARLTYVSGSRDFALAESAAGIGTFGDPTTRQILVGGNANRPDLAGNFDLSIFPTDKLTIVTDTAITSNRIDGASSYTEFVSGLNLGQTIYFNYLGIRTVASSNTVNYQMKKWLAFYGGYNYSDRLVRTVEGFTLPAFAGSTSSDVFNVSNHLNSGVAGIRVRPWKPLTITLDGEIGRANHPLTPVSDKNYHSINGRALYRVSKFQFSTSYKQIYNLNAPFFFSTFNSHSRNYSANASWTPRDWFSLDAGYSKLHLDTRAGIAFFAASGGRNTLQALPSYYTSNIHAANLSLRLGIRKRVDVFLGYSITKDTGDGRSSPVPSNASVSPVQALLDSVQTFPLTYQSPMARLSIRISPKVRWNAGWQYYGYDEQFHLFGYNQNFRANTGFTSISWSF
jgi:hypothetical protein